MAFFRFGPVDCANLKGEKPRGGRGRTPRRAEKPPPAPVCGPHWEGRRRGGGRETRFPKKKKFFGQMHGGRRGGGEPGRRPIPDLLSVVTLGDFFRWWAWLIVLLVVSGGTKKTWVGGAPAGKGFDRCRRPCPKSVERAEQKGNLDLSSTFVRFRWFSGRALC